MSDAQSGSRSASAYAGAEIRAELARQKMSGRELSRRLGCHQTQVHRRINDESPLEVDHLHQIAAVLDVPVERFFPPRASSPKATVPSLPVYPRSVNERAFEIAA